MSFLRCAALFLTLVMATGCDSPASHASHAARPAATPPAARAVSAVPGPSATIKSVRYRVLREMLSGPTCQANPEFPHTLEVSREYLHLLGPDTLLPALRKLQCPVPAQRHTQLQDELTALSCDDEELGAYAGISVSYNACGVLSLLSNESTFAGGPYPNNQLSISNYDLASGRAREVTDWLRPEKERELRELLTRYLLADRIGRDLLPASGTPGLEIKPYLIASLPELGLNQQGIYCLLDSFGAPHAVQQVQVTIPFAALRAYVRPGSPLAWAVAARR